MERATASVRGGGVLLAVVLSTIFVPGPAAAVDLTVASLEVTQAVTNGSHPLPLIAERSTAVRVRVAVPGNPAAIPTVSGKLHIWVNGSEITPTAGRDPINPSFKPPASSNFDGAREDHTLNFEIPAPTGIPASSNVVFKVHITSKPPDSNLGNNDYTSGAFQFVNGPKIRIYCVALTYGTGVPYRIPSGGEAFVKGVFPVNDGDSALYQALTGVRELPRIPIFLNPNGNYTIDKMDEVNNAMGLLEEWRMWAGGDESTFLYGWANFGVTSNGWSGHRVAFGNIEPDRYQRTFAHELGHMVGLGHNNRTMRATGWDVGNRLGRGRVKSGLKDIMVPGLTTGEAWVDSQTYRALCNGVGVPPSGVHSDSVLAIQGVFDRQGNRLVSSRPVFTYPFRPVYPTASIKRGRYVAKALDAQGEVLASQRFDAFVQSADGSAPPPRGFFAVRMLVKKAGAGKVASVRIDDTERGARVKGWERSLSTPSITITSPSPGAEIGDTRFVQWKAEDADSTNLLFQVVFSLDGGQTFVPLGLNLQKPGLELRRAMFPDKETREGLIRVFVSDGLNTASADVNNLALRK